MNIFQGNTSKKTQTYNGHILTISHSLKRGIKCRTNSCTTTFQQFMFSMFWYLQVHQPRQSSSIPCQVGCQFCKDKTKKFHRMHQNPNILGGSSSNRDNVRTQIQFWGKRQSQHHKKLCFVKNRSTYFYINSTRIS